MADRVMFMLYLAVVALLAMLVICFNAVAQYQHTAGVAPMNIIIL